MNYYTGLINQWIIQGKPVLEYRNGMQVFDFEKFVHHCFSVGDTASIQEVAEQLEPALPFSGDDDGDDGLERCQQAIASVFDVQDAHTKRLIDLRQRVFRIEQRLGFHEEGPFDSDEEE